MQTTGTHINNGYFITDTSWTAAGSTVEQDTRQLLQLDQCRHIGPVVKILQKVTTPLKHEEWQLMLKNHPNQALVQYILSGIRGGFRIGFNYRQAACKPARCNLLSAEINPEVVATYLQEEVALGRVVGPLPVGSIPGVQVSPFGVIPKGHTPGKWRLIVDLSSPSGYSVNDGISSDLCSLSYINVDDISRVVRLWAGGRCWLR